MNCAILVGCLFLLTGRSTESTSTNTFSGLKKPREQDMAYLSTSSYLRQMVGTEKGKKHDNSTSMCS